MTDREFEKKVREAEIERRAARMAAKMTADRLLEMDAPEEIKMVVRVVEAARDVEFLLHDVLEPMALASDDVNVENLKKWLFFLGTIKVQIKHFADKNPIANKEESGDD